MSKSIADSILEELGGAFQVGKAYFIKTVTYHYIGRCIGVGMIGSHAYVLLNNVVGVGHAGVEEDATVRIVTGKAKPKQFECFPLPHVIRIWVQAITEDQEFTVPIPTAH